MDTENTSLDDENNSFQYEYDEGDNVVDEDDQNEIENNVEYIEYNNENSDIIYDGICIEDIADNENIAVDENVTKLIESDDDEIDDNETESYYCGKCNMNFQQLEKHIRKYHENESVMIDTMLNLEDSTSSDKSVENITTDIASNLKKTEEDVKAFWCEECDIAFQDEMNLKSHINAKHIDLETENNDESDILMETLGVSLHKVENKNTECLVCKTVFSSVKSLKLHARMHKPTEFKNLLENTKCSICNTVFPSAKSLKLHGRMHKPIELKNYKTVLGNDYKKHFKNIQYFKCDICEKKFDLKLKEEHKKFHQNDKKLNEFVCTRCNKKFLNETNFQMHLKLHESQMDKPKKPTKAEAAGISLPYACQYCGREFARPHEKVKHERIHTGEKPFKCEVCGKSFRVTYSLTLHLRTHTTARPYVCGICNKRFKSYSVYSHHLNTHSEERLYKCLECPKTFKTSVQLHGHKNSHTKPFNCPECNRPFATMYAVKTHMETHKKGNTNLKHCCLICGATYSRAFALRDHMREVHDSNVNDEIEIIQEEEEDKNNIIIEETALI